MRKILSSLLPLLVACAAPAGGTPTETTTAEAQSALIIQPCPSCRVNLCGLAGEAPCNNNGTLACTGWTQEVLGGTTCQACGGSGQTPCNEPLDSYAGETGCEGWYQPNAAWYNNPTCAPCGGSGQVACSTSSGSQENGCQSGTVDIAGTCTPCGGIGEAVCMVHGHAICQAGLTNLGAAGPTVGGNYTCGVPATVLNMGSVSVTGPLATHGLTPWTTLTESYAGGLLPVPPTPAGAPPGPSIASPGWVAGTGFTVTDPYVGQAAPPRIFVPRTTLTLEATVSFADDTSKLATWLDTFSCSPTTTGGFGVQCPAAPPPPAPPPPWIELDDIPGIVEGNHAHYTVTVQRWDAQATGCAVPPAAPDLPSQDPDYQGVYDGAPAPAGLGAGCWVNLASNQADLYGSSVGASSATVASRDGTVSAAVSIPVTLPAVSNYLRYVVNVWEGDTRIPASVNGTTWSSTFTKVGSGDYTFQGTRPQETSGFSHVQALTPFQLVVQPQALAQLKALPYTLVYQPPGNASKASYSTTTSFGVAMAFDNKLANTTDNTVDNKGSLAESISASASGSGTVGGVTGSGSIGATLSASQGWDQSTKVGVGTTSDLATNQSSTLQQIWSLTLSNANLVPGANGTYAGEPFWGDTFALLLHPQLGLWQIGGQPVVSLLAAAGTPAAPEFVLASVKDLDSCYTQTGTYAAGFPLPPSSDVLTSSECYQLLQLDPLYGVGQSLPSAASNPRLTLAGSTTYGQDPTLPGSDKNPTFSSVLSYQSVTTQQAVGTYAATITRVLTTSDTFGESASAFGISGSISASNTDTATSDANWTVTLQSSYTATAQSSTTITGNFDNKQALPYYPDVVLYQDSVFGSFLFQDPTAPGAPVFRLPLPIPIRP